MKTRITVIFDGAKFDYELRVSKHEVLTELSKNKEKSGFIHFVDTCGNDIRIIPSKIPLLEIVELERESE